MRTFKITNDKGRDAEVHFGNKPLKAPYSYVDASGQAIKNQKFIKSTGKQEFKHLISEYGSVEELAEQIISGDPEIDMEVTGQFLVNTSRVYVNEEDKIVYRIKKTEKVYNKEGELIEEREFVKKRSNINTDFPIMWTGKLIPKAKFCEKFVSLISYRITHDTGLKYDFLYDMASKLAEKNAMMLLAGGEKGNEPLIFQDGGKPYRAFLEGRIKGDQYLLIVHLSNMELKPIPTKTEE